MRKIMFETDQVKSYTAGQVSSSINQRRVPKKVWLAITSFAVISALGLFALILPVLSKDINPVKVPPKKSGISTTNPADYANPTLFGKPVQLKWKALIGKTTFRSTIQVVDTNVVVNSNGISYGPGGDIEDGVYVLDGKTGNILKQIVPPHPGENDVNGIAVDKDKNLYFGTDNKRFYRTNLQGDVAWSFTTKGHVEGAPALGDLNGDNVLEVVFGDEAGYVYALNTRNGVPLWKLDTTQYVNEENNDLPKAFVGSPALVDLDLDKALDVMIGSRDGLMYFIKGKNSKIIGTMPSPSAINGSPLVVGGDAYYAETYSNFYHVSIKEGTGEYASFLNGDLLYAFFSSPAYLPNIKKTVIGSDWSDDEETVFIFDDKTLLEVQTMQKISASNLVTDLNGDNYPELWVTTEGDGARQERDKINGKIHIINTQTLEGQYGTYDDPKFLDINKVSQTTLLLDEGVEATPTIADIDQDGMLELLVASLDGYIYCYSLNQGGTVYWGQFRGNNQNTGVMRY